jgi:hypothetical protein
MEATRSTGRKLVLGVLLESSLVPGALEALGRPLILE